MSDFEPHVSAGAFALNALDDSERERMVKHLETCAECRDEVREMQAVAARVGSALAASPPAAMRDRALLAASQTPQLPAAPKRREAAAVSIADFKSTARASAMTRTALAAAAVVFAIFAVVSIAIAVDQHAANQRTMQVSATVASILGAPDAQTLPLSLGSAGSGNIVMSAASGEAFFVSRQLAPAPPGKTYEMWAIDGSGAAIPSGLMSPSGGATLSVLSTNPSAARAFAVTVEPAGGSPHPTSAPIGTVKVPL
jgi:anti-sigma-K factor RskA